MTTISYHNSLAFAQKMDVEDPLRHYKSQFLFPSKPNGELYIYFCGNSLGVQPKAARAYIENIMQDWGNLAVKGHFNAKEPWMSYHELLTEPMAKLVGAKPIEVVVMNTLTVNLHLMLASFYQPKGKRYKFLIEKKAFPSDRYAVESQIRLRGLDPKDALLEIGPRSGEDLIRTEDIAALLEKEGENIALIMLGGINYYTGQVLDMKRITALGKKYGCKVGFDLAHAAGNIPLSLHEDGMDFAVWCTYKYLNSGPGNLGGVFVHERHAHNPELIRLAGWWGHDKASRFMMEDTFIPIPGAEGWQISNHPIISLASIRASLEMFVEAGMDNLRAKSLRLTGYLEFLLDQIKGDRIRILTPRDPQKRGCQLSMLVKNSDKSLFEKISKAGIIVDWREPGVIRVAPTPIYNSFEEVYKFAEILRDCFL